MHTHHRKVADTILAQLQAGTVPWIRPWHDERTRGAAPINVPTNGATGRRYSGANVFLLWLTAFNRGFSDGRFLTFKQALDAGGNVRKGEQGSKVYYVSTIDRVKEGKAEGDEGALERIPFLKEYTVFNIAQCEKLPDKLVNAPPAALADTLAQSGDFADFIAATGASVQHGGNVAVYRPGPDYISVPHVRQFRNPDAYRATLAHELTHWTGHRSRLDRQIANRFGGPSYAAEELVAELGAALICAEFGIDGEGDGRHAAYIANWIRLLTDHERAFFAAASAASKAVDFLRGLVLAAPLASVAA